MKSIATLFLLMVGVMTARCAVISNVLPGDVVHETKESHKIIVTQAGPPSVVTEMPAKAPEVAKGDIQPPHPEVNKQVVKEVQDNTVELSSADKISEKPNLFVRTSFKFDIDNIEHAREILKTLEGLNLFENKL